MGADLVGYLVGIVVLSILSFLISYFFLSIVIRVVEWINRLAKRTQL